MLAGVSEEPVPVLDGAALVVPVPVVLVCAYATPMAAANEAMAAARVKLFGNLLMWISPVAE